MANPRQRAHWAVASLEQQWAKGQRQRAAGRKKRQAPAPLAPRCGSCALHQHGEGGGLPDSAGWPAGQPAAA